MAKVKFKALTDAAYKAIQAADIDTNKLYFVTDKGALYKGATLIADVTANSAGAFKYKGTIGSTGATVTTLPAVHEQGWIYIVLTAGTYAGKSCQIGDMIVCKASGSVAADTDWDIIPLNFSVVNNAPTLAWGTTSTVATIDGKPITVALPSNPNTDTKVTSAPNHYTPIEDTNNKKTASGAEVPAVGTTQQVIKAIKLDSKGHVVGIESAAVKDTNTDTKVTSAANHYTPSEDTTENASGATGTAGATVQVITGIKMDAKGHVTGVVSGAATDTDTKVTSVANHYTPDEDENAAITPAKTTPDDITTTDVTVTVVTGIKRDAKGHVTGVAAKTIKATDTKPTQTNHYTPLTEDTNNKQTASGATVPAVGTTQQVIKAIKLDSKGHVVGIESAAVKDTDTKVTSATNHYTPISDSSAKKTASGDSPTAGGSGWAIKTIHMDDKGHVTGIESVAFGDTMGDLVVAGNPTGIEDASDDLANGEVNVNFLPGDGNVHAHKIEGVNGCEVTYDADKSTIFVECTCCEWE